MSCPLTTAVPTAIMSHIPTNTESSRHVSITSKSSESGATSRLSGTRPDHYARLAPQPIEVIEAWSLPWHLSNVIKYVARAGRKGEEIRDLRKARWYLDRYIGLLEGRNEPPAPQE
jgi:hypothetical protein